MKPPWIDQGWSLVAGALANRGVHPPPTTSRPSLPPRCATAPPTAFASPRPAATPPAAAGFQSLSSPSSSARVRKRVARLPAYLPLVPASTRVNPRPRVRYPIALPAVPAVLRSRPPSRPTNPSVNDDSANPLPASPRERAENTEHYRRCHLRIVLLAPFLRSHGHHFRWKVLGGR